MDYVCACVYTAGQMDKLAAGKKRVANPSLLVIAARSIFHPLSLLLPFMAISSHLFSPLATSSQRQTLRPD